MLNDNLNVKKDTMEELMAVRDDCLCNIKENMPLPYIKLIHCYFFFYDDMRILLKKNGTMINLKGTLQRDDDPLVDVRFDKTKHFKRIHLDHAFLFTEQYGDKNYHHWFFEQFVVIKYYLDILEYYPNCKLLMNKNSKCPLIFDIVNLMGIKKENLVLVDNDEIYMATNLYVSSGRTFNIDYILPYINKFLYHKISYSTDFPKINRLYIGDDDLVSGKVNKQIKINEINSFNKILGNINSADEIIFDIHPFIDIVYLHKNIRSKKIVLLVNEKVEENIIYINLLRKCNLDVYIVQKEEFE